MSEKSLEDLEKRWDKFLIENEISDEAFVYSGYFFFEEMVKFWEVEQKQKLDTYIERMRQQQIQLEEAKKHIEILLSVQDDECRWDHNKNCQNHGDFKYDGTCYVASARAYLEKWK